MPWVPEGYTIESLCPPVPRAFVPDLNGPGGSDTTLKSCIDNCNNCHELGQICCPDPGCGSSCKQPIVYVPFNAYDKANNETLLKNPASNDPATLKIPRCPPVTENTTITTCQIDCEFDCIDKRQLCCSNGCGRTCVNPIYI